MPEIVTLNLAALLPMLIVAGGACVVLMVDLFTAKNQKRIIPWLTALVLVVAAVFSVPQMGRELEAFGGMLVVDGFTAFFNLLFLVSALLGVLIAAHYLTRTGIGRAEYYVLLMFSTSGMMVMAAAADLIVVFLGLELLSIPLYVLAGFARPKLSSEESAMKYFLLGAFSSAFFVYGIALVYGATGSTALALVAESLGAGAGDDPLLLAGMGLILVGLGFKVAAVPFHMWTPDVYHGAPTPVTGFMSVSAKAGGFAALLRIFVSAFPAVAGEWGFLIELVAAATLILGNVVAISQTNIKRMLAYSSIAHAGYIMMAVAAANGDFASKAVSAALFYLMAYTFTNIGAFAVVIAVERDDGSGGELTDFAGLGRTHPVFGMAMALFMLSLTGIPPTGGFVGKFLIFQAALEANLVLLAIVGVVTSLISAYYYLRVVILMFMEEGKEDTPVVLKPALQTALILTAIGTFGLGIVPGLLSNLADNSLLALLVR